MMATTTSDPPEPAPSRPSEPNPDGPAPALPSAELPVAANNTRAESIFDEIAARNRDGRSPSLLAPPRLGEGAESRVPELPAHTPNPLWLDIHSPREQALTGLVLSSVLAVLLLAYLGLAHSRYAPHDSALWSQAVRYIPVPLLLLLASGALRLGVRDGHLLHVDQRTLNSKASFFGLGAERVVLRAGDLREVYIREVEMKTRHRRWMEYAIIAEDRSGASLEIASPKRDLQEVARHAQAVAAVLEAPYRAFIL